MDKKSTYSIYSEIISGIFYYQEQQIELKIICLKLMLGTFAIIGGLFFSDLGLNNVDIILICSILPLLSLIAVSVGLFHDLVYKEGLKLSFFSEAIRLEKANDWLPEFHQSLISEHNLHDISVKKQIYFYFGCAGILLFLSALGFSLLPQFSNFISRVVIFIVFICVFLIYICIITNKLEKLNTVLERIENEKV